MKRDISMRVFGVSCGLACVLSLAGCNTAPSGNNGGVIDSRTRTGADTHDRAADSVSLFEFADEVGQNLAADFSTLPKIKEQSYRVVLEMGSIQNMTETPSSDFAAIQRRVFLTLQNSDFVRNGARIVERRGRVENDAGSASQPVVTQDPMGREPPRVSGGMKEYSLGETYFLQGTFSELSRAGGRQSTYQFDFTLTHAETREIIYARQFSFKQLR